MPEEKFTPGPWKKSDLIGEAAMLLAKARGEL